MVLMPRGGYQGSGPRSALDGHQSKGVHTSLYSCGISNYMEREIDRACLALCCPCHPLYHRALGFPQPQSAIPELREKFVLGAGRH